ncbi:MAG TPA: glycosyltransferase family 39 protein [Bryobacteraceae bacterium]|nr:glycosyltransferase family 39 protein [Bryobacteraceae bacterium]
MSFPNRFVLEIGAVALLAALALAWGIRSQGMASGAVDPILHAGAQDEAVYGHEAALMARTGEWGTPVFLERFALNKPPLLLWAGAAIMSATGIGPVALRLPVLAAGALCCALVYGWLRRSRSVAAAIAAVALLLANPVFFSMSRRFMTDALLTLFVTAAMFLLAVDPTWIRRWTPLAFGALAGVAVMTKSAAGLLPLLMLAVYWVFAGTKDRPPLRKILIAIAVTVLVAAPWHIYQFVVHQDWFVAEYVQFQLLGSGLTAPSRYTGDSNLWFYLNTFMQTDPILLALWAVSIPGIVIAWKQNHEARLLAAWFVAVAISLGIFGTRAAYYLMPLLPVLVLTGAEFSSLFRGRVSWLACAAAIVWFGARVDYKPHTVEAAPALDRYAQLRRSNELLIVGIDDEFYGSVLDLPKVRYVYVTPLDATKTSEFFYRLGMILPGDQFCSLAERMPEYEARLRAWKLPGDLHPEATLIDSGSFAGVPQLILCSPDRDFLLPGPAVADDAHVVLPAGDGRFFLLAKKSTRRDPQAIAPGTVVTNQPH